MSLSSAVVWEVRPAGSGASDSNGGGFVAGATGTDFSQQDSAQYSGTNLVIDAATASKVTSATHNFVAADVGNLLQITAGSGFTLGFYQIVSVASNAATLDRSAGTLGSTGGTFAVGGALASPGKAAGAVGAGNDVWIKAGTYSISTTSANVSGGRVNLAVGGVDDTNLMRWVGYGTTRGDGGGPPVLQVAASGVTGITIFTCAAHRIQIDNLAFDGQGKTGIRGWENTGGYAVRPIRCLAQNCTNSGFVMVNYSLWFCRATGCSAARAFSLAGQAEAVGCVADGNTSFGFAGGATSRFLFCVAAYNTGAGIDGFYATNDGVTFSQCTAIGNTQHGFNLDGAALLNPTLLNCVSYGNGGYGYATAGVRDVALLLNCAGGSNTSGNVNSTNLPRLENFIALTADPFVNAAGGNYALNTAAGGGALLRAAGALGAFPGGTTTGALDIGAVQHADSGGGGTPRRVWG